MKTTRNVVVLFGAVMLLLAAVPMCAQAGLTDPYEIQQRNVAAMGGLDKIKAQVSNYSEVEISVMGLSGTVKTWSQRPTLRRQEVDLKVFKQVSGDNGQYPWSVDANGKVQIVKDPHALDRRRIGSLLAEFENLNPRSQYFHLAFGGVEKVGDRDCYVVRMTNTINSDTSVSCFDTTSFLILRTEEIHPDEKSVTLYSDFREVEGVKVAFHQEITDTPGDQKTTVQITQFQPNVPIAAKLFDPPTEDAADYHFVSGTSAENIPFEYVIDHVLVPVTVGCKTRLWYLDSGAGISVVDSTFLASLGIQGEGQIVGQGTGGTASISFAKLPEYEVQGVRFDPQTVGCLNLQPVLGGMNTDSVGILGYDFLSRFVVKVDYAHRLLSLYDPKTFTYSGDGVTLDAPLQGNLFTIPITIDDSLTGRFALDLGAGDVTLHYPFVHKHNLQDRKGVESLGQGVGGTSIGRDVQFESITLGGFTIKKPVLEVTVSGTEGTFNDTEKDGNIGNYLLRHFVLYMDYANQKIIVEKGADFGRKFPVPKSGLQLENNDEGLPKVIFVSPGTPAAEAGFKVGDAVLEVNGIPVRYLGGLIALRDMLSEAAGTRYEFTVSHEGKVVKRNLTLRYLYGK